MKSDNDQVRCNIPILPNPNQLQARLNQPWTTRNEALEQFRVTNETSLLNQQEVLSKEVAEFHDRTASPPPQRLRHPAR